MLEVLPLDRYRLGPDGDTSGQVPGDYNVELAEPQVGDTFRLCCAKKQRRAPVSVSVSACVCVCVCVFVGKAGLESCDVMWGNYLL